MAEGNYTVLQYIPTGLKREMPLGCERPSPTAASPTQLPKPPGDLASPTGCELFCPRNVSDADALSSLRICAATVSLSAISRPREYISETHVCSTTALSSLAIALLLSTFPVKVYSKSGATSP